MPNGRNLFVPGQQRQQGTSLEDIIRTLGVIQGVRSQRAQAAQARELFPLELQMKKGTLAQQELQRKRTKQLLPLELQIKKGTLAEQAREAQLAQEQLVAETGAASILSRVLAGPVGAEGPQQPLTPQGGLAAISDPAITRFAGESKTVANILKTLQERAQQEQLLGGIQPIGAKPGQALDESQQNILNVIKGSAVAGTPLASGDVVALLQQGNFLPALQKTPAGIQALKFKMETVNKLVENGLLPKDFDIGQATLQIVGGAEPRDVFGEFLKRQAILEQQRIDAESRRQQFLLDQEVFKSDLTNKQKHDKGLEMGRRLINDAVKLHNAGSDIVRSKDLSDRLQYIERVADPQGTIGPSLRVQLKKLLPVTIGDKFLRAIDERTAGIFGLTEVGEPTDIELPQFQETPTPQIQRQPGAQPQGGQDTLEDQARKLVQEKGGTFEGALEHLKKIRGVK